jgi:hypothetical protein
MTKASSTKKQKQPVPTASTSSRPELNIDWCTHEAAKYAVENWHYSRKIHSGKMSRVGVWEGGVFIGCVVFASGACASLGEPYGLSQLECCELIRIALRRHVTPVSRILSIALRFLKKQRCGMRLIVSFADQNQGHHGGIYQANGWLYAGQTAPTTQLLYKGEWRHTKSFRNDWGGLENVDISKLKKRKSLPKHRYLMPLDDEMRKQIEPLRKPYPKRVRSVDSDTSAIHAEMGGANPTRTLSIPPEE